MGHATKFVNVLFRFTSSFSPRINHSANNTLTLLLHPSSLSPRAFIFKAQLNLTSNYLRYFRFSGSYLSGGSILGVPKYLLRVLTMASFEADAVKEAMMAEATMKAEAAMKAQEAKQAAMKAQAAMKTEATMKAEAAENMKLKEAHHTNYGCFCISFEDILEYHRRCLKNPHLTTMELCEIFKRNQKLGPNMLLNKRKREDVANDDKV